MKGLGVRVMDTTCVKQEGLDVRAGVWVDGHGVLGSPARVDMHGLLDIPVRVDMRGVLDTLVMAGWQEVSGSPPVVWVDRHGGLDRHGVLDIPVRVVMHGDTLVMAGWQEVLGSPPVVVGRQWLGWGKGVVECRRGVLVAWVGPWLGREVSTWRIGVMRMWLSGRSRWNEVGRCFLRAVRQLG